MGSFMKSGKFKRGRIILNAASDNFRLSPQIYPVDFSSEFSVTVFFILLQMNKILLLIQYFFTFLTFFLSSLKWFFGLTASFFV
jgi:hypothetical protein